MPLVRIDDNETTKEPTSQSNWTHLPTLQTCNWDRRRRRDGRTYLLNQSHGSDLRPNWAAGRCRNNCCFAWQQKIRHQEQRICVGNDALDKWYFLKPQQTFAQNSAERKHIGIYVAVDGHTDLQSIRLTASIHWPDAFLGAGRKVSVYEAKRGASELEGYTDCTLVAESVGDPWWSSSKKILTSPAVKSRHMET